MSNLNSGTMTPDAWRAFQAREWEAYLGDLARTGSAFGHFSVPEFEVTERISERLAQVKGKVLDIGCGVLPMPNYLKLCASVVGIDPYYGDGRRAFPFAQAMGEALPFVDDEFDAALLMSALDHCQRPLAVLREAWRVLQDGGLLFVWYIERRKKDHGHPWWFSSGALREALAFGFSCIEERRYSGDREAGYPVTKMLIAQKR